MKPRGSAVKLPKFLIAKPSGLDELGGRDVSDQLHSGSDTKVFDRCGATCFNGFGSQVQIELV
jgi:hypothetical protein